MMSQPDHLNAEDLDLMLLGALSGERAERVRQHLESCVACRADQAQVTATASRFQQYVFPRSLAAVQRRGGRAGSMARWAFRLVPLAAVASLAVVVWLRLDRTSPMEDYVGVRGGARWTVVAARGEAQRPLQQGDPVREGDRLRFIIEPGTASHLLVLSIDGVGQRSVYFPPEGSTSAQVRSGRQELPGSIQLDASPGEERLFAVFSQRPLSAPQVLGRLAADPGAQVEGAEEILRLSVRKESP